MNTPLIICMGVSGCGKTTCARAIAETLGLEYVEADEFHPQNNKRKMIAGIPLTDEDREPWMRAICDYLICAAFNFQGCVLSHSALKSKHRDMLRETGHQVVFVHLAADKDTIAKRLGTRKDHFMPLSLLESQFAAFESVERESDVIKVDAAQGSSAVATDALSAIEQFYNRN